MTASPPRARIAFFGHNSGDAAVRRRAIAFQRAGYHVSGFMPRRGPAKPVDWDNVDLGETHDNDYGQRIRMIFAGAKQAVAQGEALRQADMIYARNLDMLAMAARARRLAGLNTPLVYECLDIHHRLSGDGTIARALRRLERRLLRQSALLVVSSPRFEQEHFRRYHPGLYDWFLVENRLIDGDAFGPRPTEPRRSDPAAPLRIGWFGNLRCARSLKLLQALARTYPQRLELSLRGYPAPGVFDDFEGELAPYPNIHFAGRYRAPQDLEKIYGDVDLVWAGDWYEAGANSVWLLPNRIYEGGYFATPALAPGGTETARWLGDIDAGIVLDDPIEATLIKTVGRLIDDRAPLLALQQKLLAAPRSHFVEGPDTMHNLVRAAGVTPAAAPAA